MEKSSGLVALVVPSASRFSLSVVSASRGSLPTGSDTP